MIRWNEALNPYFFTLVGKKRKKKKTYPILFLTIWSVVLGSVHFGLTRNLLCKGLPFSSEGQPLGIKIEMIRDKKDQKMQNILIFLRSYEAVRMWFLNTGSNFLWLQNDIQCVRVPFQWWVHLLLLTFYQHKLWCTRYLLLYNKRDQVDN